MPLFRPAVEALIKEMRTNRGREEEKGGEREIDRQMRLERERERERERE